MEGPDTTRDLDNTTRDLRTILLIQAVRAGIYGFGSILIGTALGAGALSSFEVGLVFTAMLAGMGLSSLAVGRYGHLLSRRRLYHSLLALMGASGAVFALTDSLPFLLIASLTGTLSTDPNESGPITSIEQAMISDTPAALRVKMFGRYNAVAYVAGSVGALAAGGPAIIRSMIQWAPSNRAWLLAFPVAGLASAALALRLSGAVDSDGSKKAAPLQRSKGRVRGLAVLFALDSFGGGFIVQTFIVFWFHRRFGVGADVMGLVFFAAGGLQAASSILAAKLGSRIGLLNTMVFTHLPSNVLLALVPLAPSAPVAIALLLGRFALSQMDVPTRQAYLAAIVDPHERTAAAAYTNSARYLVRPLGPAAAGAAMQSLSFAAPFVAAGGIKIVYDLILLATFRHVGAREDQRT